MGKTTTNRKLLEQAHIEARLVMDMKGEYAGMYNHPVFYRFADFTKRAAMVKNCVVLIEEATIHLKVNAQNDDMTAALVNARHYGNTFIMSFHSLQRVPKYIFELSNMVILHKTGDQIGDVKAFGDPKILAAFIEIEKAPMLKSDTGVEYSPQKVLTLY